MTCSSLRLLPTLSAEPPPHVTPQTFPASQIIPVNYTKPGQDVGSNSGLTVWKALEIRTRFKQVEIDADQEDCVLAVTPEMITQLMLDAEAASNGALGKDRSEVD